ncbi:energy-coupling factor transporter transmembrane component T family protein [Corynebacterium anserum]|uniref:Energy-coupling factor transporter transmembrane protein EcfT n=1 Tax=Corynebacterium anserum TaxID=2684406 RepID=A0A7G7YNR2_9CORY|nr:energy-coupling factor transporter transmembrane protein EcfT [Corynebacterium anserum]MBC2681722.1 energy-coupling factor transporter transmembrane protein EcfT [Corynebacterium anserum]QNH96132.1 energy-coupling factor transporter transmembrane protein EcfT [Corynebacterium anserum]
MRPSLHLRVPDSAYIPGRSPLHRMSAGTKTLGLVLFLLVTALFVHTVPWAVVTLGVTLGSYVLARITPRQAMSQLIVPLPVLLLLAALLWWRTSFIHAAVHSMVIFSAVAFAILLTMTTKVSDMMDTLEHALHPLKRWGVPVESISLAMSLTMRLIPLQMQTVNEVLDARKARGGGASIVAFGVPVIVRSLLRAKAIGEALMSRGVGD